MKEFEKFVNMGLSITPCKGYGYNVKLGQLPKSFHVDSLEELTVERFETWLEIYDELRQIGKNTKYPASTTIKLQQK